MAKMLIACIDGNNVKCEEIWQNCQMSVYMLIM